MIASILSLEQHFQLSEFSQPSLMMHRVFLKKVPNFLGKQALSWVWVGKASFNLVSTNLIRHFTQGGGLR